MKIYAALSLCSSQSLFQQARLFSLWITNHPLGCIQAPAHVETLKSSHTNKHIEACTNKKKKKRFVERIIFVDDVFVIKIIDSIAAVKPLGLAGRSLQCETCTNVSCCLDLGLVQPDSDVCGFRCCSAVRISQLSAFRKLTMTTTPLVKASIFMLTNLRR